MSALMISFYIDEHEARFFKHFACKIQTWTLIFLPFSCIFNFKSSAISCVIKISFFFSIRIELLITEKRGRKNELQLCNNRFFVSLNMLCAFIFIMKIVKVSIVMGSVVFSCDNKNNNNASEAFHDDKKRTKN